MKKAYIIFNDTAIATVETSLKNGSEILFSSYTCKEEIDRSRDYNLVNAKQGKISSMATKLPKLTPPEIKEWDAWGSYQNRITYDE